MENLPWAEKYRPQYFKDIILENQNKIILENMLTENCIPHLLFYGPPGTGKTTTIINLINNYQKKNNEIHKELVIHLNASDDRGIDIIRNQIHAFTGSTYLFNRGTKFIVLDEIDYMTKSAQQALYNLMKNTPNNVRFCLICNYISKLEKSLQNICMAFKFNTLPKDKIKEFLISIIQKEELATNKKVFTDRYIENIIDYYKSDIRSMINYLQSCCLYAERNIPVFSNKEAQELLHYFINNSNQLNDCERKLTSYLKKYNIEKHDVIIKIINYLTHTYELEKKHILFIKIVIRYEDYYLPEFNKFFISNISSLFSN